MSAPPVRFPIGLSDFREVREGGFSYVDKTALIDDVLAESAKVMLIPRPRRFGKTLNLSMLRYFLEKSVVDVRSLFAGLAIASSASAAAHFPAIPGHLHDVQGRQAHVLGRLPVGDVERPGRDLRGAPLPPDRGPPRLGR